MFNSRAYEELCLRLIQMRSYDPEGAEAVSCELLFSINNIMSFVSDMGQLMPRMLYNYCLSEKPFARCGVFCLLADSRRVQSEMDTAERRAAEAVNRLNGYTLANRLGYMFYFDDANDLRRSCVEMARYMVEAVISRWSAPELPACRRQSEPASWSRV